MRKEENKKAEKISPSNGLPEKTIQRIQSEDTVVGTSKKAKIIDAKIRNAHLSLKEIAKIVHCSHSHARRVWAKHQRGMIQRRGSPSLPYSVHGSWKENAVPVHWLNGCPLVLSRNRNGQRMFKGKRMTLLFHKNGKVMVYAYCDGWEQEVREFLGSFWNEDQIEGFMASLEDRGTKAVAFDTPSVPRNFKVRVKGIGSFHTDTTPYPDGTTEFEYDPELLRRIDGIEKFLSQIASCIQGLGKIIEGDSQVMKQNTEALQQFSSFLKDLSAPKPRAAQDRSVV